MYRSVRLSSSSEEVAVSHMSSHFTGVCMYSRLRQAIMVVISANGCIAFEAMLRSGEIFTSSCWNSSGRLYPFGGLAVVLS